MLELVLASASISHTPSLHHDQFSCLCILLAEFLTPWQTKGVAAYIAHHHWIHDTIRPLITPTQRGFTLVGYLVASHLFDRALACTAATWTSDGLRLDFSMCTLLAVIFPCFISLLRHLMLLFPTCPVTFSDYVVAHVMAVF